jgi:UDP-N-acetyl-D-galactosamine dehydrogenase
VGGHCIGVDPYYLATASKSLGHNPQIILAGREINESMANELADLITQRVGKPLRLLVLGLTFKENVPDLRNTKVVDLIAALKKRGHVVDVHDSCADPEEAKRFFDYNLVPALTVKESYEGVIGAVMHDAYCQFSSADFQRFLKPKGWIFDLKAVWRKHPPAGFNYWTL